MGEKPNLPIFEDRSGQSEYCTTCYMCACRCGIKVTVENEKVRFIRGNPDHPVNRGVLCGKGNAAIMKQYSPAKLRSPLMRDPDAERGSGALIPISWEEALGKLTERLSRIRAENPNKLAFFTGRDQMQALTGLWASQFGTLNWAAHGGFCSVNMAASGLTTTGYSFWEFGEPDWDLTRYFMLWGVAEDHASNPIKLGLTKLKQRGVKIVAINPVRTGYQAIADEWVPIRPGTDGLLAMSMAHVLLSRRLIDEEFLIRQTNAPWLIQKGTPDEGLVVRDANGKPMVWDMEKQTLVQQGPNVAPALFGEYQVPDGQSAKTAMTLITETCMSEKYAPANASKLCGVSASDIERLALELAAAAFESDLSVNTPWVDWAGRSHTKFVGRPVSMHAMRGVSAHSNGFHSCRAIHLLQALLGSIDAPGGHLAKPPYPKRLPCVPVPARTSAPNQPLAAPPLGIPRGPEDLVVDESGAPLRIDKAFSWDAPLAAHGMLHMVIANAVRGDPYPIDTLMVFMANLAWNSSMNTNGTIDMIRAKDADGVHKIPFIVSIDSFHSEMAAFSDLVLPDTTFLERHDTISLLDRPISEPHAVCDAIRAPVVAREHDTRPWQEVMVDLAGRLGFPAFVKEDGSPKYSGYEDFIVRYEQRPGIGFLAGWRGEDGDLSLCGAPNPQQWDRYIENGCFFKEELPPASRYRRHINRDYLNYAQAAGWVQGDEPIVIELYSELLRKFQRAGEGKGDHIPPRDSQKARLRQYFNPTPFWHPPLNRDYQNDDKKNGTRLFHAVTQRPMFMYHSWDSQNAWLRQIADRNPLFINSAVAIELDIGDGDWLWISSENGTVAARAQVMDGLEPNTVWTWNAIGKYPGAWGLSASSKESVEGFLMNHLISEWLPSGGQDDHLETNSDPVTGQAAWYDLRVSIAKMTKAEVMAHLDSLPDTLPALPGTKKESDTNLCYATHRPVNIKRSLRNVLFQGRR